MEKPPTSLIPPHPVNDVADDHLGMRRYAEAISTLLKGLDRRFTGFTVGLFGDWGSGKTSLLRLLRRFLEKDAPDRFLFVEFEAWRYVHQEDLWLAFLRRMLAEIYRQVPLPLRLELPLAIWWHRFKTAPGLRQYLVHILLVFTVFLTLMVFYLLLFETKNPLLDSIYYQGLLALVGIGSGAGSVALMLSSFAYKALAATINGQLTEALPPVARAGFDKGQTIAVDEFRQDFEAVIRTVGQERTIVVLIDDLDRCPLDQIIPVLEAIQHFDMAPQRPASPNSTSPDVARSTPPSSTEAATPVSEEQHRAETSPNPDAKVLSSTTHPEIIFVLAVDPRAIESAVAARYDDYLKHLPTPHDAQRFQREYLQKIVHLPFYLPPLGRRALQDFLTKPGSAK
jgi:hypothetical protein